MYFLLYAVILCSFLYYLRKINELCPTNNKDRELWILK